MSRSNISVGRDSGRHRDDRLCFELALAHTDTTAASRSDQYFGISIAGTGPMDPKSSRY